MRFILQSILRVQNTMVNFQCKFIVYKYFRILQFFPHRNLFQYILLHIGQIDIIELNLQVIIQN